MGRASCRDGRSRGTVVFRIDLAAVVDGAVVDGAVVGYCSSCGDYMLEEKGRALLIRWPVFICVRGLIRVWSEALYTGRATCRIVLWVVTLLYGCLCKDGFVVRWCVHPPPPSRSPPVKLREPKIKFDGSMRTSCPIDYL